MSIYVIVWYTVWFIQTFSAYFLINQVDSEDERLQNEKYVDELAKKLPQGTDKTPEVLEEALKGLPDK